VNYYTHLPTVVCPSFDPPSRVREFVKEYRVRYIILFGKMNIGPREEQLHEAQVGRFISLSPDVRIWEFSPELWK
ncbi:MAG: hypothetical protein KY468_06510, partial [Armatimonadetes bacterium]|nr:hypothetical protein [Armatimonadota bacterium]